MLKAADGHLWRVLWYTIALTGCRRGEALGLQWADIDRERHTITIQRTLTGKAARRQVHEPKTASGRRVVAATRFLMDLLKEHQHQQKLAQLAAGPDWVETGFVFTTRTGKPLDGDNVRRAFKKLLKAAGLPPETRIHDLRHAMATWWLSQGVPVKVVSERLGHTSIAITLQLYGHVLSNMRAEAAEQMDAWLLGEERASPRRHKTSLVFPGQTSSTSGASSKKSALYFVGNGSPRSINDFKYTFSCSLRLTPTRIPP
ncbi:protein of unknown function [Candidatus Hydrogenisulfobacillus filiaventi]|uniref:Tyr recombinase domain-containing protein n=1 Tax=Candidatus Hydrogenisulfobacillus filiaventi TaxID=2707344 RepID=A0A6F8ZFA8_9FIRM|nr:protein of unknown function [Candidatus Hydrogenisulfobacillus filiaventi]